MGANIKAALRKSKDFWQSLVYAQGVPSHFTCQPSERNGNVWVIEDKMTIEVGEAEKRLANLESRVCYIKTGELAQKNKKNIYQ